MSSISSGENLLQTDEFLEKSSFKKLLSDLKQQFFSLIFTLAQDQKNPSLFFFLSLNFLRFMQLLHFPFHQEVCKNFQLKLYFSKDSSSLE